MLIPLKLKYRQARKGKKVSVKGGGDGKLGAGKGIHKLDAAAKRRLAPQPKRVMRWDAQRGRGLMVTVTQ